MKIYPAIGSFVLLAGLTSACGGGISASKDSDGAIDTGTKEITLQVDIESRGEGLNLQASPTATIYAQRLNFTMDCSAGGGTVADPFMALGTDSGAVTFTANFTTTVPAYCVTPAVVSLVGKFDSATTGMTFTLTAAAAATTYRSGTWSVHASLTTDLVTWTALFEFDKAVTEDTDTDALTARETINGTVTVTVNDLCAGAAAIAAGGSSTSFVVDVPHALTGAIQWTELQSDTSGAISPYTEDGEAGGGAGVARWTFDFESATTTDTDVAYELTVAEGDMQCIAVVTFNVTATDGTPTAIP